MSPAIGLSTMIAIGPGNSGQRMSPGEPGARALILPLSGYEITKVPPSRSAFARNLGKFRDRDVPAAHGNLRSAGAR
jgi:hypothetical protein